MVLLLVANKGFTQGGAPDVCYTDVDCGCATDAVYRFGNCVIGRTTNDFEWVDFHGDESSRKALDREGGENE